MKLRIVVLLIACVGLGFYIQQLGAAQGLPAAKPNQTKSIDYIKENWSLEVTKGMFGTRLSEHPGAVPASTNPSDDSMNKLVWYSTDASSNYGNQFPGRSVLYGFKDGKMAAVCLLTGMAWDNDEEKARAKKQWIANLYTNFN